MSTSYSANLIYGFNYSEVPKEFIEKLDEYIDVEEIQACSPYYDAPRIDWVIGIKAAQKEFADFSNLTPSMTVSKEVSDFIETLQSKGVSLRHFITMDVV